MKRTPQKIKLLERQAAAYSPAGRFQRYLRLECQQLFWTFLISSAEAAKRSTDVVLSALALVMCAPLFLLIAAAIKLEDCGPVLFSQMRVGRCGREFRMYKFRSMRVNAEAHLKELLAKNEHREGITFKLIRDPRITRVGRVLRKLSFDELPQFYNVLRGDMTLVGPRPPVPREVEMYSLADRRRLEAKPGLTCFWQISGRSQIDFSGQVALDVKYIENQSFWLDCQILAKTLPAVLSAKGAC